mgnify:CR=1 FL=1|jgi:uncharacterized phage protein (TIGR01671 family)
MIPIFRVWHHELGRMMSIKNMWFQEGIVEELELNDTVMNDYITSYPDEVTIMQSTGLKDKNGKEIFEGDVVYNGFRKTIVNYGKQAIEEEFGAIREYVGFNLTLAYGYPEAVPMNYEIIGNIYENPELL